MSATHALLPERDVGVRQSDVDLAAAGPNPIGEAEALAHAADFAESAVQDKLSIAERAAHRSAMRPSIQEVASELNSLFGRELLAVMTGIQSARTVTQWIRGESEPHPGTAKALRDVDYVAAFLLQSGQARETVQAWFVGMNPQLKGQSPAELIGRDSLKVLEAAKAFVQYS